MKNQDLHSSSDEQIRDLLSKMKVGYDKSSWSALEKKMDSISSMQETDQLFKNSLSTFQANYVPSSWSLLQHKMDYMMYNRRHLIGLKVTELAIIFLMFWFWLGTDANKSDINQTALAETIGQEISPSNKKGNKKNIPTEHSAGLQKRPIQASSIPNESLKAQNSPVGHSMKSSKANLQKIGASTSVSNETTNQVSGETAMAAKPVLDNIPKDFLASKAPFITTDMLSGRDMRVHSKDKASLDFAMLNVRFNPKSESLKLKAQTKRPFQYWVSGAISYDKDLIRTPFPSQQSVNHLGRIERSYHGEINLFVSNGMLEFQTGVGFWAKDYHSVYEGINDALVISIPANLRLRLSQRGFMRGYLMGGLSTNFVAYANYNETSYLQELENTTIIENNYQARPSTIFSSTGFDHGIFEGESVKGNQYFTVNMGIGVDIPLNPIISLYMEQVYFHHLSGGIGPAFDKFSTSSTIIGLRYLLNKNTADANLNF